MSPFSTHLSLLPASLVFSLGLLLPQAGRAAEGPVPLPGAAEQSAEAQLPALPPGVRQLHSEEGVTEYELPNGLRILLAPDESKSSTTVNMTYLVGSRHENYGETGMAHLLEHMLFKGTPLMRNALAEFARRG